ncbi:MAG: tyrosine-type recombinase/integrase [Desulfovibrionaceae bacterium]|nr:tyrosine-type recombinase/integrase [Desulfovibrionaceae bacterium]
MNRRIRPYDLRHTFATELIAAGTDIGTVAKLMGHSSPTMLLNHYQYTMDVQNLRL